MKTKFIAHPQKITASEDIPDLIWIVTISGDDGNAETGPHPYFDEVLVKAPSAATACRHVHEANYVNEGESCEARKATPEEINLWANEGFKPLEFADLEFLK